MNSIKLNLLFVVAAILSCGTPPPPDAKETTRETPWEFVDQSLTWHQSDQPSGGFVPDERTAILIAEAVAAALYGQEQTESERPFRARLKGDVWTVVGHIPYGMAGGAAVIQISKTDGRILFAVHQQ